MSRYCHYFLRSKRIVQFYFSIVCSNSETIKILKIKNNFIRIKILLFNIYKPKLTKNSTQVKYASSSSIWNIRVGQKRLCISLWSSFFERILLANRIAKFVHIVFLGLGSGHLCGL